MPKPLSNDLRKRIIEAHKQGKRVEDIVEVFSVGRSTIYKLLVLVKETGSYEPRENNNGRKSLITEVKLKEIEELIKKRPDMTLEEIKEEMGLPLCISALSRIITKKLNYRYKKNSPRQRKKS
ncbi:MAG: IS630 transposase-related protein [Syntrophomonadaceae bacterium]|jgi:putative transposase|nr:IS630 transposase-related protein [Syntrophomonadaceae bacterium]